MIIWGMVGGCHDATISIFKDNTCVKTYYSTENRHSQNLIDKAFNYGKPDLVVWYEKPWAKAIRQWLVGQPKPFKRNNIRKYLRGLGITCKYRTVWHHESHAAHYYKTDKTPSVIVVIDAVGEFSCTSIWTTKNGKLTQRKSVKYPNSLGLFYSSMTQRCGFKPSVDESKLEKFGKGYATDLVIDSIYKDLVFKECSEPLFKINMHRGIGNWKPSYSKKEIAGSTQVVFENMCRNLIEYAISYYDRPRLIVTGGCAFNKGLQKILHEEYNAYIPENPGDAGSAETAVLAYLNR